jgi:signal peptidase II
MSGRARYWGLGVAVAGIILDQAHKAWMLGPFAIETRGRVPVAPFLDLVIVWNRGVSYGLLAQEGELGRYVLAALGVGGAILFGWWMWHASRPLSALALGLVVAGALSNAIDRVAYGAVADFFLFHVGAFEWYVFNLADVWIVAGVAGLLLAWATERREIATET